jgi:tRNA G37 N-methylase Trm5
MLASPLHIFACACIEEFVRSCSVLAVEINPKLVAAGKENMKLNGVDNVECMCVNAQHFSRNMLGSQTWRAQAGGRRYSFSAVLVDPPRAGLDKFTCSKVRTGLIHLLSHTQSNRQMAARFAAGGKLHIHHVHLVQS